MPRIDLEEEIMRCCEQYAESRKEELPTPSLSHYNKQTGSLQHYSNTIARALGWSGIPKYFQYFDLIIKEAKNRLQLLS